MHNFRNELYNVLTNINENQGKMILEAIKEVSPAGIKKYSGKGNINADTNLNFKTVMKIGSKWDRISRCYSENYDEIFTHGLPHLISLKKKIY